MSSPEINLLGKTVDEAVAELDKYLDDAYIAHLSPVRIVHGKGTDALRNGIHQYLPPETYQILPAGSFRGRRCRCNYRRIQIIIGGTIMVTKQKILIVDDDENIARTDFSLPYKGMLRYDDRTRQGKKLLPHLNPISQT